MEAIKCPTCGEAPVTLFERVDGWLSYPVLDTEADDEDETYDTAFVNTEGMDITNNVSDTVRYLSCVNGHEWSFEGTLEYE